MDNNVLPQIPNDIRNKIWIEFGLNKTDIKETVESIKAWLELQPHLPNEDDDIRLEFWLLRCKNSVEKTKQSLDMYYTLKSIVPELLTGWDTNSEWFKIQSKVALYTILPKVTPEGDRVLVLGLQHSDPTHYNFADVVKMTLMVTEIRMSQDYCRADICIVDLANLSFGHVAKHSLAEIKKYEVCLMQGYKYRIKAIHFVNVPTYADILIEMVKMVFKSKIVQRIQVHRRGNITSLHNHVSKELLPIEYGGECGSVFEHWQRWVNKLQSSQEWLSEREQAKSDESRRPNDIVNASELFGFEGSFRKLVLD